MCWKISFAYEKLYYGKIVPKHNSENNSLLIFIIKYLSNEITVWLYSCITKKKNDCKQVRFTIYKWNVNLKFVAY